MKKKYIYLKNFFDKNIIDNIFEKFMDKEKFSYGRVGVRIDKNKKRRNDRFLKRDECCEIDKYFFDNGISEIKKNFDINIKYREQWKIGHYCEEEKGFYNPHSDTQGGMEHRVLSIVVCLSSSENYDGGIFNLIQENEKFKFNLGDAIIFDSKLLHGVEPVTKGNRYVLISFLLTEDSCSKKVNCNQEKQAYDFFSNIYKEKKFLLPISVDSGPGNQLIGIKESLILSKFLDRELIFPYISQHYTLNSNKYWNFNDIYTYDNKKNNNYLKFVPFIDKVYCFYQNYLHKLKLEKFLNIDIKNQILLKSLKIKSNEDMNELKNIDDKLLTIKHIFNNLQISNCFNNGCSKCDINKEFLEIYKEICSKLNFSNNIIKHGNKFIKKNFKNKNFISIHLRYNDNEIKSDKPFITYDENDIYISIKNLFKILNKDYEVFIATNNQKIAKSTKLNEFKFYDIHIDESSFIEQYICAKSKIFIFSNNNNYNNLNDHSRSTWSSFVVDYRNYFLKKILKLIKNYK